MKKLIEYSPFRIKITACSEETLANIHSDHRIGGF